MNLVQQILVFALRVYRWLVSPVLTALFTPLGFGCRFTPTCSEYALDAVRQHGAAKGIALTARRLGRCHPWGGWGHDPVPGKRLKSQIRI
jgi:putative membrane protein insertion efficiency factor